MTNTTPLGKAHGVWAPAMTPLDEDLAPDSARMVAHVQWLLANGCHGIGLFGTTGEATSFSVEERTAVLEAVRAAGVSPEQLMVGTGCCALTDTLSLTRHALAQGCTQMLMLPPFYYKGVSDDGLYASYAEVIERVGDAALQIYFYHFPKLSMVPITHAVIERLLKDYPGACVGLKDSSGDAEGCAAFIKNFPELAVFPGTETLLLDMLKVGGVGCITASGNVNPAGIRKGYDAFVAGDGSAEACQAETTAIRMTLQQSPMIPVMKYLLARERGDQGWLRLRPPLTLLSAEEIARMDATLPDSGFRFAA